MDVDSIPLGVNFTKVLRDEVAKCEVLLAVIGPNWLNANDEAGHRRLDNPHDFVRIEIATALQRDISVIPILLDGATIPKANQLPKDLKELAVRNGLEVRHAPFHSDMEKLIRGLKSPSSQVDASAALPLPSEGHETEASRKAEQEHKRKRAEANVEAERRAQEERSRRDKETTGRVEGEERQKKEAAEAFGSTAQTLPALQRQSWWPPPIIATSGALAVAIIAVLFWVENKPPVSPQQVSVVPSPSTKITPPVAPATQPLAIDSAPAISPVAPAAQPPPIDSAPILSPVAPQGQSAKTPSPQVPDKIVDATLPGNRTDDSIPINDPGLLNEVRERLYELNFDPGTP
jgi:hypothetical protein